MTRKKIISVDWLKHGEVWVCDLGEVVSPKVRMLTQDEYGELNIEYYYGFKEEDTNEWRLIDPENKYFIHAIFGTFRKVLEDIDGLDRYWFDELKEAVRQGLDAQVVVDAIGKLYEGKVATLSRDGKTYEITPEGEWVEEKSKLPFTEFERWYWLKNLKLREK